jgi:GGL domain
MSDEEGGLTAWELLQQELNCLKKTLAGVEKAENTSKACARVVKSIKEAEPKDFFLTREGIADHNLYHTSAGGGGGGEGCCMVL